MRVFGEDGRREAERQSAASDYYSSIHSCEENSDQEITLSGP